MAMTMLQMSGMAPTPATMADGVLLIIDAQREYTDGLLPLPGAASAIAALARLLEKARVGNGTLGDRPWLHEHGRGRYRGNARPAGRGRRRHRRCGLD